MLDNPPRESELRSWTWVALGVVVIYATIPVARGLREVVDRSLGREIFIYGCLLVLLVCAVFAWRNLRHRSLGRGAAVSLALVLILFAGTIYYLRAIPEEALHVALYGVLGLLVYRALTHRVRDYSIYALGALLTGIVGMIDEYIQWVVPSRYFDIDDIELNFFAGLLAQVGLAAGLRPRLVMARPDGRSFGRLAYLVATGLLLLLIGFVNTPQRVAWYAQQVPGLEFLLDGSAMMAQYGYRLRSPAGAEFRTRFDAGQLAELDERRGREVAAILDRYIRGEGYREFLARYSIIRDPYAHEAGVRLFRREFHLDRAREPERDAAEHYTIAYFENDILQAYFTSAITNSKYRWSDALAAEVAAGARRDSAYLSQVSSALITRVGQGGIVAFFLLTIGTSMAAGYWLRRNPGTGGGP